MIPNLIPFVAHELLYLESHRAAMVTLHAVVKVLSDRMSALRGPIWCRVATMLSAPLLLVIVCHCHHLTLLKLFLVRLLVQILILVIICLLLGLRWQLIAVTVQVLRQGRHLIQLRMNCLVRRLVALIDQDMHLLALLGKTHVFE